MLRRDAIAVMLAAGGLARGAPQKGLERLMGAIPGTALLVDVPSGRLIAVHNADVAGRELAPPGSTLKPFVLAALLQSGKLRANEAFPCSGDLRIAGRSFACSHPKVASMQAATALAYSCNSFVARVAERFAPGELTASLRR